MCAVEVGCWLEILGTVPVAGFEIESLAAYQVPDAVKSPSCLHVVVVFSKVSQSLFDRQDC
jgi:hypothetical protein